MQEGQCCRCNGNGTCVRCECSRNCRQCRSCMLSKKKRCRNFPNHSSQPTNRDFETDTLTVPASQPSQAPPCTRSSACVTVASDTGLTAGPASFDVRGADADLQLLSSSCPPLLNCQREQDWDTPVDTAVDTAVSTVWVS